jgi:hypothetical protein
MQVWIFCFGCSRAFASELPITNLCEVVNPKNNLFLFKPLLEKQFGLPNIRTGSIATSCYYENCKESIIAWGYWEPYKNYILHSTKSNPADWPDIPLLEVTYEPTSVEDNDTFYEDSTFEDESILSFGKFFRMFIVNGGSFYNCDGTIKSAIDIRLEIRNMLKGI